MIRPSAANGSVPTHMSRDQRGPLPGRQRDVLGEHRGQADQDQGRQHQHSEAISLVTMIDQFGSGVICSCRSQPDCRSCAHGTAVLIMRRASAP